MVRPRATNTELVLEAAARVFGRKGYRNATIDDVAAEAGVSKATLYQYAKNKQWLMEAMVDRVVNLIGMQARAITEDADASAPEKLERFIVAGVRDAAEYRAYYTVIFNDHVALEPQASRRFRAWARDIDATLEGLLRECAAEGSTRDDVDFQVAAKTISSMMAGVHRWYDPKGRLTPDEIAGEMLKMLSGFIPAHPSEPAGAGRQRRP
jgi:AcrR family transcriptional regulator